jgi:hypothetical protein
LPTIYFQLKADLNSLKMLEGESVRFVQKEPPVEVVISQPVPSPSIPRELYPCTGQVIVTTSVSERLLSKLEEVTTAFEPSWGDGYMKYFNSFPDGVRTVTMQAFRDARGCLERVVKLIRWRRGILTDTKAMGQLRGLKWSRERSVWRNAAFDMAILSLGKEGKASAFDQATQQAVQELLDAGQSEPLSRELFMEAIHLRDESPRSSLFLAIAATEVGVKELISALVPDSKWLAFNVPSPPVERLLREYVHQLPLRNRSEEDRNKPAFSEEVLNAIKLGVTQRNQLAHSAAEVKAEPLKDLLIAVHQVLRQCQLYSGFDWQYLDFDFNAGGSVLIPYTI